MPKIRSLEERIMTMKEKLRELQDRKRLRDMQDKLRRRPRRKRKA